MVVKSIRKGIYYDSIKVGGNVGNGIKDSWVQFLRVVFWLG
jgi:hypothetical protein